MNTVVSVLYGLAYLGALAFAMRFFAAKQFMPYHAQVTGKSWDEIDGRVKVLIIGLMRMVSAGLFAVAIAGLWLAWLRYAGAALPSLLVALPGLIAGLISFGVVMMLRRNGSDDAPVVPVATLVALVILGLILSLVAG